MGERRSGRMMRRLRPRARQAAALTMAAALAGGVLTLQASSAAAIPTTHEIKANWAGTPPPPSIKLGTVANAEFHINTNDANIPAGNAMVDNVTVTIVATNGKFASIPSSCQTTGVTPLSSISADGLTLICNLGTIKEGTATVIQAPLRATATFAGSMLSASGTVTSDSAVAPAGPGSVTPIPITYTNGLDLVLNYAQPQNYQGYQQLDENGNLRQVMRIPWSLVLKDGSLPGPANYSFPLKINSATVGAKKTGLVWERCLAMSTGVPAQGHPSSAAAATDRTNFPGCSATGSNLNWTINLTGLDYTLTQVPVNDTFGNPLPGGGSYIASGYLEFSIPGITPVTATYTYTATPPAVTFSNGQTLAEGPTANNDVAVTVYAPGDFSNAWHGTPTTGRSVWDDRLILSPGSGMDIPIPAADGIPAGDPLPLYMQASSYAWNDYTGAGGTNVAGVCTMKSHASFVLDKADYFGYNPGFGYVDMPTATFWYHTGALNTKTDECNTANGTWTKITPAAGTVAGDPRANNTYLMDIPDTANAVRVLWNPKIDKPVYVAVRGFGYISDTAAVPSEGWTVGSFNAPSHTYWNYSNINQYGDPSASVTETPWSTYATLADAGTNGYRDVYRIVGYEGIIKKAAADTSAAPGVPVDFTITAQASSTAANPQPVTFTVVDTIPTGMTYVAGSATPAPYQISGQTITWRFVNATPNVDYTITYKAQTPLGSTLAPGTELTNTAVINVTGDPRPVADRPSAEATVVVPNNGATILGKSAADNVLSFYGDSSSWKLAINSFDPSSNAWTDTIDVLPYKGDPRGSNFDGAYTVGTVVAPAGSTIYYTTANPATISEDPRDLSNGTAPHTITGNTVGWTTVKPAKPTAIRVFGPALAPGALQTITINYTTPAGTNCVTPAAGDNKPAQTLVNSATTYAAHTALPMKSSASTVIGDCYALDIVKSVLQKGGDPANEADWHDADSVADYPQYADGDTAPYRIVVTNKGSGTLTNVAVTDSIYPVCNTIIPSLAPLASQTILCDGVVHTGTTVNTATATADPADGPNLTASDPAGVVVPQPFVVQKVSAPPTGSNVKAGDTVTYTVTITEPQSSPAPYTNPSITDNLAEVLDSADYVLDSENASFGTVDFDENTGVLSWSAPQLMPGQTVTITYDVVVKALGSANADGDLINSVVGGTCITGTEPGCTTTLLVPQYTVAKTATPDSGTIVTPGTVVTYNVVVTNTGPVPVLATVADDLSAVLDDAVYNNDATAGPGNAAVNVAGNNLTWSDTLAFGETVTLTYSVTVRPSALLTDGILDNVVTATGPTPSCLPAQQGPECETHHDTAAVRYEKVIDQPDVLNIGPGDSFTYTITATNVGNTPLTGLTYTDDMTQVIDDAGYNGDAAFVDTGAGTSTTSLSYLAPTMTWSGDIGVGGNVTITYSVTLPLVPLPGDNVLLNAIVGNGPGSNCVTGAPRPECTTVVPKPDLHTVKTITSPADPSTAQAGDTIAFQIVVTNDGSDTAHSVPILDDMSAALDDAVYNNDASAVLVGAASATTSLGYAAPQLLWVGEIAAGGSVTIVYTMTVNGIESLGDGVLTNYVLSPDCPNPPILDPQANGYDADCVTITPIPAYTIVKSSDPAEGSTTRPGATVTYSLTLTNTGGEDLTPTITDNLPGVTDDAAYVLGSAAVDGVPITPDPVTGNVLVWTGSLAVDQVRVITYQVTIDDAEDLGNGSLGNYVWGTGPSNCPVDPMAEGDNPYDPAEADPRCANIVLVEAYDQFKSSTTSAQPPHPGGHVWPGDSITYTVTIENTGGVDLNPTIYDDLSDVLDDATLVTTGPNEPHTVPATTTPTVDPNTKELRWSGLLAVGETIEIVYSVTVNEGDELGNGVIHNVTSGTGPTPCPLGLPEEERCVEEHLVEAVVFKKIIDNPNVLELQPGDTFTYQVTATNVGEVDLTAANGNQASFVDDLSQVLDDADLAGAPTATIGSAVPFPGIPNGLGGWIVPPTLNWNGDLLVGQMATITYSVTVKNPIPPLADAVLINGIAGTGPGANCQPPIITDPADPNFDPDCTTRVPQPILDTVKTIVSPADPQADDVITYQITTTNTGVGPALGVTVVDDLTDVIDDATYLDDAAVVGGGSLSYTQPEITWTGDIPAGGSITITYHVKVNPLESLGNGVLLNTIVGPGCPENPLDDDDCFTETPIPAYTIVKSSDPVEGTTVKPGDTVDYTLTLTNIGGEDIPVTITDDLTNVLDSADYVVGSSAVNGVMSAPDLVTGNQLVWNGTLPLGATYTITYSVTIKAVPNTSPDPNDPNAVDTDDGLLDNVVRGTGPNNCATLDAAIADERCNNHIPVAAYTLVKSSNPANGAAVKPGDLVTYTLTIVNTGGVPLSPSIEDDLSDVLDDAEYTPVTQPDDGTGTPAPEPMLDADTSLLTWTGNVDPGETVLVSYGVTIKGVDPSTGLLPGDGVLDNVVTTVDPDSPCPDTALKPAGTGCATTHPIKAVRYEKTVNAPPGLPAITPSQEFTYTVTIRNIGTAALDPADLHFVDDLTDVLDDADFELGSIVSPVGAAVFDDGDTVPDPDVPPTITWNGGALASGASTTVTYDVTVKNPLPVTTNAILVNKVTGAGPGANCLAGAEGPECRTQVPEPRLESSKGVVLAESNPVPGGTITYEITVNNTGDAAAINFPIVDDFSGATDAATFDDGSQTVTPPGGNFVLTASTLTWTGTIPAGGSITIRYTMTVHPLADLGDATLTNALLTPDCPNPPILDPQDIDFDIDCVTETPIPGFTVEKTSAVASGNNPLKPGDTVTYTVTVANIGAVALNPTITDDLTAVIDDATYNDDAVADAGPSVGYTDPILSWTGPLPIDGIVTITYSVTVKPIDGITDGVLDNIVVGTDPKGPSNCPPGSTDTKCTEHHVVGAWDLIKTANTTTVVPGATITYTIIARNVGGADLTGLTYDDNMSAVLDDAVYQNDAVASSGGVSYAAPTLTWTGDLAVGAQAVVTYTVKVNNPFTGDRQLTNPVTTDGDGPCPPQSGDPECIVDLLGRQLTIVKDTVPADIASAAPGETVHYRFTVTNTGILAYLPATVVDALADAVDAAGLPTNVTVTGPGSASVDAGAKTLTWSGPLQPGEAATIDYDMLVTTPLSGDGRIENVVSSSDPGANCPTALAQANGGLALAFGDMPPECKTDTPIRAQRVVKTSNPGNGATLQVGQLITYTVTISNTGQAVLTPATLTDDLTAVLDDATLEGTPVASSGNVSYSEPVISWSGDLGLGASATVTYSLRIKAGGDGQLRNTVISNGPDSNCPNGSADGNCTTTASILVSPPPPPATTPTTQPEPGELPATGGNSNNLLQIVLLLGLSGAALVLISRRRRRATS